MSIHPVFHVSLLYPHSKDTIPGCTPLPPPPIEIEGEEEYEVEEILNSRLHRGRQLQYLVKWKGYSDADNSWEPATNLENAPDKITEFHRLHPGAPRRIASTVFSQLQFRPYYNFTELLLESTSSKISGVS